MRTEPLIRTVGTRPRGTILGAIAVGSLALGFLLGHGSLDRDRVEESVRGDPPFDSPPERASPTGAPEPAPPSDSGHPTAQVPAPDNSDPVEVIREATPPPGPPAEASPPSQGRRVELERFAYLRCAGAEIPNAQLPCPRDRPFEQALWEAAEALAECPDLGPAVGRADLRLEWANDAPVEIRYRSPQGEGPHLDGQRVVRCLRPFVADLRPEISAHHVVVSVRLAVVSE